MPTRLPHAMAAAAAALLTTSFVVAASGDDAQVTVIPSATPATAELTAPPSEESPSADLAADFGTEVRGSSVISGPDLMAQLDPSDPRQAQDRADIQALLEATGAGLDQLTMLNAVASDGKTFVGAIRVEGADQDVVKSMFVESALNDLGEPRESEVQIGGKDVTRLIDDAAEGQPPLFIYAAAEVVWLISGTEEAAAVVLETLP